MKRLKKRVSILHADFVDFKKSIINCHIAFDIFKDKNMNLLIVVDSKLVFYMLKFKAMSKNNNISLLYFSLKVQAVEVLKKYDGDIYLPSKIYMDHFREEKLFSANIIIG